MNEKERLAEEIFQKFNDAHGEAFFSEIDRSQQGEIFVLSYLTRLEEDCTAGQIAKYMDVSTARVAVILNSLEKKGFIEKKKDLNDKRKTIVHVTEKGMCSVLEKKERFYDLIETIIDQVGIEKINAFIETMREISGVAEEYEKRMKDVTAQEYL